MLKRTTRIIAIGLIGLYVAAALHGYVCHWFHQPNHVPASLTGSGVERIAEPRSAIVRGDDHCGLCALLASFVLSVSPIICVLALHLLVFFLLSKTSPFIAPVWTSWSLRGPPQLIF